METKNDGHRPMRDRKFSTLSYEQKELLKVGKKLTSVGLQVRAVNELHKNVDGACAHCAVPYPCETKRLMREARESV